jgi:DNA-binding beta-propeller fold protein YncE
MTSPQRSILCLLLAGLLAACSAPGNEGPLDLEDRVFVSLPGAAAVEIVEPQGAGSLGRTEVGMLPHNMVLSPDGARLYVVLVGSQAIAELDTETGELLRTFLTEPVPERRADGTVIEGHVTQDAFGHTSCYTCHRGGEGSARPAIVGTRPFGLIVSEDGERLLVSHMQTGNLTVIGRASGEIKGTVHLPPTGEAHQAVDLAQVGDHLFVSMRPPQPTHHPSYVRMLDARTFETLWEAPTGADANVLLADPTREQVLVSNFETNTVSAFHTDGSLQVYTVGPGPMGLTLLPDGRHLLVANYYGDSASLLDLDTGTVTTSALALGEARFANPTHGALASGRNRAYLVSAPVRGHLLTVRTDTLTVEGAIPIGGLPFDVIAVPKR